MKTITTEMSIFELIKLHPEIKEIMLSLGFDNITSPVMLNTVGRMMNLRKGAKMKDISLDHIKDVFLKHGFILIDEE